MFDPELFRDDGQPPVCHKCGAQLLNPDIGSYTLENGGVAGWKKELEKPGTGECPVHGKVESRWTKEMR